MAELMLYPSEEIKKSIRKTAGSLDMSMNKYMLYCHELFIRREEIGDGSRNGLSVKAAKYAEDVTSIDLGKSDVLKGKVVYKKKKEEDIIKFEVTGEEKIYGFDPKRHQIEKMEIVSGEKKSRFKFNPIPKSKSLNKKKK